MLFFIIIKHILYVLQCVTNYLPVNMNDYDF